MCVLSSSYVTHTNLGSKADFIKMFMLFDIRLQHQVSFPYNHSPLPQRILLVTGEVSVVVVCHTITTHFTLTFARFGMLWYGLHWGPHLVWYGMVWFGLVWLALGAREISLRSLLTTPLPLWFPPTYPGDNSQGMAKSHASG